MADGYMGWAADAYTTDSGYNSTFVGKLEAARATIKGSLYKFDCRISTNGTIKIKVFRDDGTNYNYIGGESFALVSGLNSGIEFVTPIAVEVGDMIAYYGNNVAHVKIAALAGGMDYKVADVVTNSAKATWTATANKMALLGYIAPVVTGGGILNWWISFSEAFKRHDKLWTPKGLILPKDLGFQM